MPELSFRHHTLIQALLSRGPLPTQEFHKIFEGITGRNPSVHEQVFNDYLLKINKELSFVQFELRACRNQYDGKVYYGVVNNVADDHSKLGTKYSVPQISFFKGIIEAIVNEGGGEGCISNIDALHVRLDTQVPNASQSQTGSQSTDAPAALRNFSLSQKEKTLEELVKDGWLSSSSDGKIGLGVRSFLDLRSWFRLNEVPACEVCNEAGVKAEMCPNEGCAVRIHKYCLVKKFSQRTIPKVCPGCSNPWPFSVTKEEAVDLDEQSIEPPADQPPNEPSSRKRRRNFQSQTQTEDSQARIARSSQSQDIDDVRGGSSQDIRLRRSARLR